jgi:hypothetical protein
LSALPCVLPSVPLMKWSTSMAGSKDSSTSTVSVTAGPEDGCGRPLVAEAVVFVAAVDGVAEKEEDVTAPLLRVVFVRKGVKKFGSPEKGLSHGWSMGSSRRASDAAAAADLEERAGTIVDVDRAADVDPGVDEDVVLWARGELAATTAGIFETAQAANSSSGCGCGCGRASCAAVDIDDAVAESTVGSSGASIMPGLIMPDKMGWKSGRMPPKVSMLSASEAAEVASASVPFVGTAAVGAGGGAGAGAGVVDLLADAPAPSLADGSWRICCSSASLCFRFSPVAGVSNSTQTHAKSTKTTKWTKMGGRITHTVVPRRNAVLLLAMVAVGAIGRLRLGCLDGLATYRGTTGSFGRAGGGGRTAAGPHTGSRFDDRRTRA